MSTNRLLTSYMEKRQSRVKLARRQAAFDVWVEALSAIRTLEVIMNEALYLLVAGGQFLLQASVVPIGPAKRP